MNKTPTLMRTIYSDVLNYICLSQCKYRNMEYIIPNDEYEELAEDFWEKFMKEFDHMETTKEYAMYTSYFCGMLVTIKFQLEND